LIGCAEVCHAAFDLVGAMHYRAPVDVQRDGASTVMVQAWTARAGMGTCREMSVQGSVAYCDQLRII